MTNKKKKEKKPNLGLIVAPAPKPEMEPEAPIGGPLITARGVAHMGEGEKIKIAYDPESPYLDLNGIKLTKRELWEFVFSICDPKMRDELMPVRQTEMTTLTKVHTVQLKRDMRKGEIMKVRCHTNVPTLITETMGLE